MGRAATKMQPGEVLADSEKYDGKEVRGELELLRVAMAEKRKGTRRGTAADYLGTTAGLASLVLNGVGERQGRREVSDARRGPRQSMATSSRTARGGKTGGREEERRSLPEARHRVAKFPAGGKRGRGGGGQTSLSCVSLWWQGIERRTRGLGRVGIGIERASPLAARVDEVRLGLGPKGPAGALSPSLPSAFHFFYF